LHGSGESKQKGDGVALVPGPPLDSEMIRDQLGKMLSSRTFQSPERQRKFLTYVVDEALAGRAHLLKEYSLGIEAFGKDESFDPRMDTIVRVEARKLRARIAKYYEEEGKEDPVRIEFIKGSYAPLFHKALSLPHAVEMPPEQSVSADIRAGTHWKWIAAIVVAILVVVSVYFFPFKRPGANTPINAASIAVLPFVNLGEESNEFFSDGLTGELIDSLGRVPGLNVVGRTSVFQFKGTTLDLREIGRKLNVRTVLEGSVRQADGRVRITAELDDTSNGYRLWSQSYDRELKDILAIQREISAAITNSLGGAFVDPGSPTRLTTFTPGAVNAEAYQDYLKGRYFWNRSTGGNVNTAIQYFEQAIAKDPNYALAYVGLAACYVALPRHGTATTRDLAPKIRAAATKALELDGTLGEAHLDLGQAFASEFNWQAAYSEFNRGLELSPGSAVGHRWYSTFLARLGRLEESQAEARKALELDPVSLIAADTLGQAVFRLRRYDEAIGQFERTLAMDPDYGLARLDLGLVYVQKGMYLRGLSEIQMARQLLGNDLRATAQLGYAYAISGQEAAARKLLNDFLDQSKHEHIRSVFVADIYVGLGDKDAALRWLQKSIDEGDSPPLKEDPIYDPLRADPRFSKLVAQMKLP